MITKILTFKHHMILHIIIMKILIIIKIYSLIKLGTSQADLVRSALIMDLM
jgi:hypothetical protein